MSREGRNSGLIWFQGRLPLAGLGRSLGLCLTRVKLPAMTG